MRILFVLWTTTCVWLQQVQYVEARIRGESSSTENNNNNNMNVKNKNDDHQIYHRRAQSRFQSIQRQLMIRYSIATGGGAGGEFRSMRRSQSMRDASIDPSTSSSSSTPVPTPPTTTARTPPPTPSPITQSPPPTPLPTPSPPTPLPTIAFNFDALISFNTPPPTFAPTRPPRPQPTPAPTTNNNNLGGRPGVSGPTFLPTPAQQDTGRTCPTPTSGAWQDLALANDELKSCKVDSDCISYFPQDGPACCAHPYCVCATLYEFYDREFKCIGF